MRKFFMILSLCLSGCVYYPNNQAKMIVESSAREIRPCQLLGQVYGESKGMFFLSAGLEIAKDTAKTQVAELGGSHVFWTDVNIASSPYVVGQAFSCNFTD